MSKKTKFKYQAVYVGRRLNGSTTVQCFELLPDHKPMLFRGIRGVFLGYTYRCTETSMPIRPEMVDAPIIHNPDWEVQDALVDQYREKRRAEKRFESASKPHLRAAVKAIQALFQNTNATVFDSFYSRKKLIEYLVEVSSKKVRRK